MAQNRLIQTLSSVLRSRRTKAGMSQEELAFEADVHPTYVSLLERAQRNPTLLVLSRLAEALGTSMTSIVREVESQ